MSASTLDVAWTRLESLRVSSVPLREGNATQLPRQIPRPDAILASSSVQYFDAAALDAHLQECGRLLKAKATLCLGLVPNAHLRPLWYPGALATPDISPGAARRGTGESFPLRRRMRAVQAKTGAAIL